MNHKPRAWGVTYGVIAAVLCTSITMAVNAKLKLKENAEEIL